MVVKNGDRVKIEYKGTLDDGTVFDSSERLGKPLEFVVGGGQVIKGVENAVIGMQKGEEKQIRLQPIGAYGTRNPKLIQKIQKNQFPQDFEPQLGLQITMVQPNGKKIPGNIVELTEETVTVDMNHPLAGRVLNFNIKTVDIIS
jgi:FKBP-type peptidyl-prolyl cis-trans isomerase 2